MRVLGYVDKNTKKPILFFTTYFAVEKQDILIEQKLKY